MRVLFFIFFMIVFSAGLNGQDVSQNIVGKVSFISSQNVYVKFKSTSGISTGDTLYITSGDKIVPALIVKNLSSMSCVCQQITAENIPVDHLVIGRSRVNIKPTEEKVSENEKQEITVQKMLSDTSKVLAKSVERKQNIRGSLSLNSYSDFSNTAAKNSEHFRYTFSLDARNIGNSKLSAETYVSFNHKAGDWQVVKSNIFNALKVYSFALKYDISKSTNISLGRRINPKISNIGAIDGLQFETSLNKFTFGAVTGFRPDFANFGFDSKLFQYGGYVSYNTRNDNKYTESSLAFMQQMNGSKTDRRFLYIQHSNALSRSIYFFSTFEVDLFKLVNDKPATTFDLTSLYLSLRYRITKDLSISGSYDARKNVMYYETYKTFIDRILESEMRQGFRLQANYRISRELFFGLSSGYRFTKSDPHPSKNIYGYLTYNQVTGLNLSLTLSGTYLQSSFMNGMIAGVNVSRGFFNSKLFADIGYRYVNNKLPESLSKINQNIGEINLSMPLSRSLFISVYYEGTFEKNDRYNRIYSQIRIRF